MPGIRERRVQLVPLRCRAQAMGLGFLVGIAVRALQLTDEEVADASYSSPDCTKQYESSQ